MKPHIAYVDDDLENLKLYKELLSEKFQIHTFLKSADFMKSLPEMPYNCFLLDIQIPHKNGIELFEIIRSYKAHLHTPVFLITSNPADEIRVVSYQKGAADFFDRLIKKEELIARLETRIKQNQFQKSYCNIGNLTLDLHLLECSINQEKIDLTLMEFKILSRLLQNHPERTSKEDLLNTLWGNTIVSNNSVNIHVHNLRNKTQLWDYEIDNHRLQGFSLQKRT